MSQQFSTTPVFSKTPVKQSQVLRLKNHFTVNWPQAFYVYLILHRRVYFIGLHTKTDTRQCYTDWHLTGVLKINIHFLSKHLFCCLLGHFLLPKWDREKKNEPLNSTLFKSLYTVAIVQMFTSKNESPRHTQDNPPAFFKGLRATCSPLDTTLEEVCGLTDFPEENNQRDQWLIKHI